MKPSKLYEALHALIGERVPLHIWGACGVGKSQIVAQIANDLDYDFLDVRAVQLDPVDLHTADATSDANAWPTPRSWEMASQVLCGIARRQKAQFLSGTSEFEAQLLDGTVGPAAASELVAFIRLFRQLPSIDEILLNPTMAPLPTEPSAQIAIATALGRAMSDTSVGRAIAYLDRMPTEMRVMAMRDAAARDTAITHTPEFVRFGVECREAIQ